MADLRQLTTPVAFIIFNRPDTTARVFEAIRQAKPPKLLVVADGPRENRPGEAEKCAATRAVIDQVDWGCEVLKNYSETNLGCKRRVSSGIDWVFQTVDEAIIVEDDCLPQPEFFSYCDELLERYRQDTRVMHIAGSNFGITGKNPQESYYFSRRTHIWGWATWRRAWQHYDVNMRLWPELKQQNRLIEIVGNKPEADKKTEIFDKVYGGAVDTWDYQWHFTCLWNGNFTIIPNTNMVENIGFHQDASTHTTAPPGDFGDMKVEKLQFPLIHPQFFIREDEADTLYFNKMHNPTVITKIKKRINKLFQNIS